MKTHRFLLEAGDTGSPLKAMSAFVAGLRHKLDSYLINPALVTLSMTRCTGKKAKTAIKISLAILYKEKVDY
jgi:hypothetical protein